MTPETLSVVNLCRALRRSLELVEDIATGAAPASRALDVIRTLDDVRNFTALADPLAAIEQAAGQVGAEVLEA